MWDLIKIAGLVGLISMLSACATVGKPYAEHRVSDISLQETTKADIQAMFGNPWRTGLESGQETWTYGHYRYSLFAQDQTSDLVVRFNKAGKVVAYTYNRTLNQDNSLDKKLGTAGP